MPRCSFKIHHLYVKARANYITFCWSCFESPKVLATEWNELKPWHGKCTVTSTVSKLFNASFLERAPRPSQSHRVRKPLFESSDGTIAEWTSSLTFMKAMEQHNQISLARTRWASRPLRCKVSPEHYFDLMENIIWATPIDCSCTGQAD